MSVRSPLLVLSVPVLTVLALCLYLRQRQRRNADPPPEPDQASGDTSTPPTEHTATDHPAHTGTDTDEPAETSGNQAVSEETPSVKKCSAVETETPDRSVTDVPPAESQPQNVGDAAKPEPDCEEVVDKKTASTVESASAPVEEVVTSSAAASLASAAADSVQEPAAAAAGGFSAGESILAQIQAAMSASEPAPPAAWAEQAEPAQAAEPPPADPVDADPASSDGSPAPQQPEADNTSENSSDSGKGGSSASLEQSSSANAADTTDLAAQPTVYDFLIPQKLCGRLIGKNGTFVNMLKARTGANVLIRLHPVKNALKICSVEGTQSEIDACLELIREKFPVQKFPAMTLEQLTRPQEQPLAVPVSQQLHLPQSVTCDVVVSAVVCPGQLFLQQHTHPTFRGLHRLNTLMAACYGSGDSTPQLPRPVQPSSICAAPVLDGWYRAQVVAYYPDTDQVDVRFMDYGGYSRLHAATVRQIRTDFMSLPFQAEECYLANVVPTNDEGWSMEENVMLESLITDRALEAMVVGYAEDGVPFVNLYSIQGNECGNSVATLVNQQLVESGAARWVENQA